MKFQKRFVPLLLALVLALGTPPVQAAALTRGEAAQALLAVTGLGLTHDDGSHHGFLFIRRNELPRAVEVVLSRGDEAVEIALADKAVIFAVVGDLLLYFGFFVVGELSGV